MRLALFVAFAVLTLAAPAQAATVEVAPGPDSFPQARFAAAAGEVNDVVVAVEEGGRFVVFGDAGARVLAGPGCEAVDEHTARCTTSGPPAYGPPPDLPISVELGDGDDRVAALGEARVGARGGPGDDTLVAGVGPGTFDGEEGADRLLGGDSADTLFGGPGADELRAGGGDDSLQGDPSGVASAADVLDGGAGLDEVSYASTVVSVVVDLARGFGPSGDALVGVERVTGGAARDTLLGSAAGEYLYAGADRTGNVLDGRGGFDVLLGSLGPDTIDGGSGDDSVRAGEGADRVDGGSGDDRISTGPGLQRDVVACGPGRDSVSRVDRFDLVGRDCEGIDVSGIGVSPPRRAGRTWYLRVRRRGSLACRVRVTVVAPRGTVRSAFVRVPPRRRRVVVLRGAADDAALRDRLRLRLETLPCKPLGLHRSTGGVQIEAG